MKKRVKGTLNKLSYGHDPTKNKKFQKELKNFKMPDTDDEFDINSTTKDELIKFAKTIIPDIQISDEFMKLQTETHNAKRLKNEYAFIKINASLNRGGGLIVRTALTLSTLFIQ